MGDGQSIYLSQMQFSDPHIVLRFLGFDPSAGTARIAIDENHANVGFYYIWVYFGSGNNTRIDYDGGNPSRDNRPIVRTGQANDTVARLEVKRVRD